MHPHHIHIPSPIILHSETDSSYPYAPFPIAIQNPHLILIFNAQAYAPSQSSTLDTTLLPYLRPVIGIQFISPPFPFPSLGRDEHPLQTRTPYKNAPLLRTYLFKPERMNECCISNLDVQEKEGKGMGGFGTWIEGKAGILNLDVRGGGGGLSVYIVCVCMYGCT